MIQALDKGAKSSRETMGLKTTKQPKMSHRRDCTAEIPESIEGFPVLVAHHATTSIKINNVLQSLPTEAKASLYGANVFGHFFPPSSVGRSANNFIIGVAEPKRAQLLSRSQNFIRVVFFLAFLQKSCP